MIARHSAPGSLAFGPRHFVAVTLIAAMWSDVPAATIIVDGVSCSIVDAVTSANANASTGGCAAGDDRDDSGDIIELQKDVDLVSVGSVDALGCASGLPAIVGTLRINGNGHWLMRPDRGDPPAFRLIDSTAADLTLSGINIGRGLGTDRPGCSGAGIRGKTVTLIDTFLFDNELRSGDGAGIHATNVSLQRSHVFFNVIRDVGNGGGIYADTVTVTDSAIQSNGAESNGRGGGIYANDVTIRNSSVESNHTTRFGSFEGGSGSGVYARRLTLVNSTVTSNRGGGTREQSMEGGAIVAEAATIIQSTIAMNFMAGQPNSGAGIAAGSMQVINSIIASNYRTEPDSNGIEVRLPSDCRGRPEFRGVNLIGDDSCGASAAGQLVGDAMLDSPTNNGGLGATLALLPGSPALDRIEYIPGHGCADSGVVTDQRGLARPQPVDGRCDIGAYELPQNAPPLLVSTAPSRAGPSPLKGAVVARNTYIFVQPDPRVARADFYLDGLPVRTERYAPFDLGATAASGVALPFDTSPLTPGAHSVAARLTMLDGTQQFSGPAEFTVVGLARSPDATRKVTVPLEGSKLFRTQSYVFVAPAAEITKALFWLDGTFAKVENIPPFDFAGTNPDGTAREFNVDLSPGNHVIEALVSLKDGSVRKLKATVSVN
ncbi:MAG: choice-of-anchor Q domain-containing protein [Methylotetracoccus sp.]